MSRRFLLTVLLLLALPSWCLAFISLEKVSVERARELRLTVKAHAAGSDLMRIDLEFVPQGNLEHYERVDLIIDGDVQVQATLKESKSQPDRISVGFSAKRTQIDHLMLRVMTFTNGQRTGHDLQLKDFVDVSKL